MRMRAMRRYERELKHRCKNKPREGSFLSDALPNNAALYTVGSIQRGEGRWFLCQKTSGWVSVRHETKLIQVDASQQEDKTMQQV